MNTFKEIDFDLDMLEELESYGNSEYNIINNTFGEVIAYKTDY